MSDKRTVWRDRIEAWRDSGQSAAGFCRSHGLVYAQFVYWQRVLRGAPVPHEAAQAMIPVAVQASPSVSSAALELELPNGTRLRVPAGFPTTEVVALVRGLAC